MLSEMAGASIRSNHAEMLSGAVAFFSSRVAINLRISSSLISEKWKTVETVSSGCHRGCAHKYHKEVLQALGICFHIQCT